MKNRFIQALSSTQREGMENIIVKLEEIGFFTAPASTKFHLCNEGGLMEHSWNVYRCAVKIRELLISMDSSLEEILPIDSVAIAALLHDICKADIYRLGKKWQKDETGHWEQIDTYEITESNWPFGHGEKSAILLLQWGLKMTDDELLAIRWHMNAWDLPFQSYDIKSNYNVAKEHCPLVTLIQLADGMASSLLERSKE